MKKRKRRKPQMITKFTPFLQNNFAKDQYLNTVLSALKCDSSN